jgi:hypothetical protein
MLPACAHAGGAPATGAADPGGWLVLGVVMETFTGAWVAALCDEIADLVVDRPAAGVAAARKVATTIRARLGLPAHRPLRK